MSYLIQNILPRNVLPHGLTSVALLVLSALHGCSGAGHSPPVPPPPSVATTYYLDCSASQNGNGTKAAPWNSLVSVNALTFLPGDRLLVNRGTVCNGALTPQGSGTANAPILIDAYGTGAQPIISGGSAEEALKLFNQQYWEINNLEITGGNRYGVYVSGNTPNYEHQSHLPEKSERSRRYLHIEQAGRLRRSLHLHQRGRTGLE